MRYEKIKSIIDHAREFHRMIAEYYHTQSDLADIPRVKMLLEYLEHHERSIEKILSDYEPDAAQKLLKIWSKYSPCEQKLEELRKMLNNPATNEEEIVRQAIVMDDCLLDLYRQLAKQTDNSSVKEILENMLSLEEHELRNLVRDSLRLYEL